MSIRSRELYRSANGDRWSLVRVAESGRVIVRHEPNPSSGGRPSDVEVGDFLVRAGSAPRSRSCCA